MPPPELTGNDPVVDIFHPLQEGIVESWRIEVYPVLCRLIGNGILGQLIHLDEPLGGQTRLDHNPCPLRVAYGMHTVFNLNQSAQLFQFLDCCLAGFKAIHADEFPSQLVHGAIVIHDIDLRQIVALADLKVVGVMGRGDFYDTRSKFWVGMFIGHDWDWFVYDRQNNIFANQVLVARVFWIDRYRHIPKHGFRPGCGYLQPLRAVLQHIGHVVEGPINILVDDLDVRKGCAGRRIPVDDKFTAVDPAFFVEFHKDLANGF